MAALFALGASAAQPAKKPAAAPVPAPAPPADKYHLQLEANPAAPFPWLGKFGTIKLDVYPSGVRAETFWLNGFSKNYEDTITVENPLGRMYTDVPIGEIANIMGKLGGGPNAKTSAAIGTVQLPVAGKVQGVNATRYRILYSTNAWIDVWTTQAIAENPQVRRIVTELVTAISPRTGLLSRTIPGTPIYVELNFTHYKKLPLVRLKSLTLDDKGEAEALAVGSLYMKAPLLDAIWK